MQLFKKPILRIASLTFLAMFNLTFVVPSIKEIVVDRFDTTTTMASLFITIEMIAYIIFGVVWGALSDKRGERRIFIVIGFLGSAMLYYMMTLAPDLTTLFVMRFMQGAMTVMAWSLLMTLAMDMSHSDSRGAYMGIIGAALALGMGLGAPIGGLVADHGVLLPLYAASAVFVLATVLSIMFVKDIPIRSKAESLAQSIRQLYRDREARAPYLFSFAERFSAGYLVVLLPLYLAYEFDSSPGVRGMYLAAFLLPFALLQYHFGKLSDRYGREWMLVIGGFAYAALLGTLCFVTIDALFALMVVSGALAAMLLPASLGLLADIVPRGEHATFMGGFNAFGSLGFAIAPLLAVGLSEWVGYQLSLVTGGAIIAVTVALTIPTLFPGKEEIDGESPELNLYEMQHEDD
ncbi:MAG: MFS transporter [Candidatus Thermoplasmatota archaeon]|nr:MFS transporter [Candidatus Thermoplasmatota archaeon]